MKNPRKHPLYNSWRYWKYLENQGQAEIEFSDFDSMVWYIDRRLGPRPGPEYRLARLNSRGAFAPKNLAWTTTSDMVGRNSRSPQYRYRGRTQNLAKWARERGFNVATLRSRVRDLGWTIKQALETPV